MHPGFTIQAPKVCKAAAPSCPLHALSRPSPLLPLNRKPILVTTRACILPPEPCPSYCPYNPTSYLQPYKFPLRLLIRLKNRTRCRSRTLTGTRASTLTGGFRPYRRYAASLGRVSQALRSSPPQESAFCEYLKGRHCIDPLHRPIAALHRPISNIRACRTAAASSCGSTGSASCGTPRISTPSPLPIRMKKSAREHRGTAPTRAPASAAAMHGRCFSASTTARNTICASIYKSRWKLRN